MSKESPYTVTGYLKLSSAMDHLLKDVSLICGEDYNVSTSQPASKKLKSAFHGSNEEYEIETLGEFQCMVHGKDPSSLKLDGWVFQEVDFSPLEPDYLNQINFTGASFWGCKFPDDFDVQVP